MVGSKGAIASSDTGGRILVIVVVVLVEMTETVVVPPLPYSGQGGAQKLSVAKEMGGNEISLLLLWGLMVFT